MKRFSAKVIMFDVDGTIVNSIPDLSYAIDKMLKFLGREKCGEQKVANWIRNGGISKLVEIALIDSLGHKPDLNYQNKAKEIFFDFYAKNITRKSFLYDGVIDVLNYLKEEGFVITCITNKAHRFTIPLLKGLDIFKYFKIIISGDTFAKRKPDPGAIFHIADTLKVKVKDCLMIGDSIVDIQTAKSAGVSVICLSYGYSSYDDIVKAKPDLIIDSMSELSEYI